MYRRFARWDVQNREQASSGAWSSSLTGHSIRYPPGQGLRNAHLHSLFDSYFRSSRCGTENIETPGSCALALNGNSILLSKRHKRVATQSCKAAKTTAGDSTRLAVKRASREAKLAYVHRSRVCGKRPRTALAIIVPKHADDTQQTIRQTD